MNTGWFAGSVITDSAFRTTAGSTFVRKLMGILTYRIPAASTASLSP